MTVGNHTLPTEILKTCSDGFVYCFSRWASDVTQGAFWTFALLGFSIVAVMATIRFGWKRAFGFGSWIGAVGAVWLVIAQLMPWWIASAFILSGILGIIIMIMDEKGA